MAGNWTKEEKQEIVKAFTILSTIQKSYGKEINIKETLQAWEYVLSDYSARSVIAAMNAWMKKDSSMPTPADLIKIMSPEKPKITQSEFIHAKQQWELEGYPQFSYYAMVVKDYEKQEGQARDNFKCTNQKLLDIARQSLKTIGNH